MAAPTASARRPIARPAPDASMDLLNQIIRQPMDPDYAVVAAGPARPRVRLDLRRWSRC